MKLNNGIKDIKIFGLNLNRFGYTKKVIFGSKFYKYAIKGKNECLHY